MTENETTNNIKHSEKDLSQRAIISGVWVFLLRVVQQLFGLARLVILARILAPNDFGLMGIALLAMATLETFSQTGFQLALIQKKCDIKPYLNSAWTFLILRGLILFAILYLIAPYAATFFDAPEAKPIIQVIGLSIVFQAFTNIGVIHFQKELEFNKQFFYQLSGTLADFIVAVVAVLILGNVWALVFGLLAGNMVMFVVSYFIHPYRPHLSFDVGKGKELFGYGKWILGSSALIFLVTQGDDILVGRLLGVTALGFYQMAYKLSNLPATEITHVISQVTFPVYSKIQDDIPKLREAYLRVFQFTTFLSFPIAGLIFILAYDFTTIFLGEKWLPMVPVMQVLVFAGLVRSLAATAGPIFYAVGKPKIDTKWQIVRLFVIAVLIYPFTIKWELLGASFVVFLSIFICGLGLIFDVIKITKCGIKKFVQQLVYPLMIGTTMVASIVILKLVIDTSEFIGFVSVSIIGFLLFLIMVYFVDKRLNHETLLLIRKMFNF
ncbi:lipopolysaccharide biosynthesis protein [Methanococcoides methylutens]|uniref:Lipopolysaccharide biosynthesis protein WzxC n=1 Tax=Methanococcoides methylutens MM1 TaxID=1434104 RepID=A0A0E3STR4_METMT|nr:lipopolysaccharide biosynthesis protein [Methanococcoides methylutens]AKB86152.1 Lipopolysaccharide biosynthesis protein WzxC [Methanococcoides methylutens MM1]